jgi:NADH:ubiquinone oxidoreductase subunit H
MSILGFVTMLLYNIIFMLIATLIIATITLTERKVLALVQRRVGPNFVGYKGRLQYLADALKLFLKNVAVPKETNKFWFIFMPAVACAICYSF